MGAHGYHALWSRPALFALADLAAAARHLVHAGGMVGGALHAAGRARLVHPLRRGLGAGGGDHLGAVRGCAYRGGDQAGLSRCSEPAREEPVGAFAGTCTCAVARWIAPIRVSAAPGKRTQEM